MILGKLEAFEILLTAELTGKWKRSHIIFMSQLNTLNFYPLPYTVPQPPPGLFHHVKTVSGACSDTAAFKTGLNNRDVFLGRRRCVVCGESGPCTLEHCPIIRHSDVEAVRLLCAIELTGTCGTIYTLISGHCSSDWGGSQTASKSRLSTNLGMG